jgi:hypothetical protein
MDYPITNMVRERIPVEIRDLEALKIACVNLRYDYPELLQEYVAVIVELAIKKIGRSSYRKHNPDGSIVVVSTPEEPS